MFPNTINYPFYLISHKNQQVPPASMELVTYAKKEHGPIFPKHFTYLIKTDLKS